MDVVVIQEAGFFAILAIVAIGLSVAAYFLFKPKGNNVISDDKPTTQMLRGGYIPLLSGIRRVGPVIGFVGDRVTTEEELGGGGKGGGGEPVTETIYHERAIHYLAVGPACRVHNIYIDGRCVQDSYMDVILNPSGSTINLGSEWGTLRIYWGELDQPFSDLVTEKFEIETRLPRVCRVEWDRLRMGNSPRWPIIEYDTDVCQTGRHPFTFFAQIQGPEPELDRGMNPAYVLYQYLTGPFPYGIGMPCDWLDSDRLEELGTLMQNEKTPINVLVQDGQSIEQTVAQILQDVGAMLADCCGQLALIPIRKLDSDPPTLTNDLLVPPFDEVEMVHEEQRFDKIIFEFPDRETNFKVGTIDVSDDGISDNNQRHKTRKIQMPNITSRSVASIVVDRRQLEELVPPLRVKAKCARNLRDAVPGHPFLLPGVGQVRVISIDYKIDSPTVTIDFLRDFYSQVPTGFVDPDPPEVDPALLENDLRFLIVEIPASAANGEINIVDLRHRANPSIQGANIYFSQTDVGFLLVGVQPASSAGGYLAEAWTPPPDLYVFAKGPLITFDSTDELSNRLLDLSSALEQWRGGRQMLVIKDEIFFVQRLLPEGDNWRCTDVIRARMDTRILPNSNYLAVVSQLDGAIIDPDGTAPIVLDSSDAFPAPGVLRVEDEQIDYADNDTDTETLSLKMVRGAHGTTGAAHADNTPVQEIIPAFVTDALKLSLITHANFAADQTAFFKNQPFGSQGALPLGNVFSVPTLIKGKGIRPMPFVWSACGGNGQDNGDETGAGGRPRRDGKYVWEGAQGSDPVEDIAFEVTFSIPMGPGAADRIPWSSSASEATLPDQIEFRVQRRVPSLPFPPSPPIVGPFDTAVWDTLFTAVLTNFGIQGGDATDGGVLNGIATWIFKEADLQASFLAGFGLGPPATPTSDVDWRVEIVHKVSGIFGLPEYCYPLFVDVDDVPNFPL